MTKDEKVFSRDDIYKKGEVIYHPIFKKSGKIKKIEIVAANQQKLHVEFEELGKKLLIAGTVEES